MVSTRLVPYAALPPYTYVPGKFPHPTSDPRGHSYGKLIPPVSKVDETNWSDCHTYLYAIDLFNGGFYWEAHEEWERLWGAAGRTGPIADLLKGLIKLAAAGVKAYEGNSVGVRRHASRCLQLIASVKKRRQDGQDSDGRFLGLSLADLAAAASRVADDPPESSEFPSNVQMKVLGARVQGSGGAD